MTPPLLISAQSSGAFATMTIAVAALLVFAIGGWLTPRTRHTYFTVLFATGAAITLVVVIFHQQILSMLLDLFEKDATITGRTDLWDIGWALINERPFFGMGYQAFWVQETALAEELWAYFKIPNRGGFHFHNTYISIGVELGMIGTAMTAALLLGSLVRCLQWAVKEPFAVPAYFVAFAVLIATRSLVEVDVFYQFSSTSITIVCGLIYANHALAAFRAQKPQMVPKGSARTILYPARLAFEDGASLKNSTPR
jgi:exopolysaccharide production protein ExoQ